MFFYLLFIVTGTLTGLLSGLLGIGGGIIMVPALLLILSEHPEIPDAVIMHVAVATSLCTMIFTTFSSSLSHYRLGAARYHEYMFLFPALAIGAMSGVYLANYIHADFLKLFFGVLLIFIAIRFLYSTWHHQVSYLTGRPNSLNLGAIGVSIGGISGLFGIGGGVLLVPYLRRYALPITQTVAISAVASFIIAVMGTTAAIFIGIHQPYLPHESIGYVYWPAVITIAIPSMLFAPVGAHLAHRAPVILITRIFSIFMLMTGLKMLWR